MTQIQNFISEIKEIQEPDYGDFMRKANGFWWELADQMEAHPSEMVVEKMRKIRDYVQFSPSWEIEPTRKKILEDAKLMETIVLQNSQKQQLRSADDREEIFMTKNLEKQDSQIQTDVLKELHWEPSLTATHITVTTNDGIVCLRGSVPHYLEKSIAQHAAQRVGGVRAVVDEIEVNLMGSYERGDEDIARAALQALKWSYAAAKDLQVTVEKAWVTLRGETDWNYRRVAAKEAVSGLMGVRGVTDEISIKSRTKVDDVQTNIEEALKRTAQSEGRKIQVKVHGDEVTLSGTVQSLTEIEDAGLAAWGAPGVLRVKNEIRVAHAR